MYKCLCYVHIPQDLSTAIITVASHSVYLTHVQFIDVVPEVGLILDIKIGSTGAIGPNHVVWTCKQQKLSLTQRSDLVFGG